MSRSDVNLSLEDARSMLRGAGLRCTSCRIAVLQHLSGADYPISHNDVADQLVPLGFDKSTIYRCLVELAEANLLARLDVGDHVWRFEMLGEGDDGTVDHPHFMCLDCGKVSCLPDVKVRITPTSSGAAGAHITEVLLKGHCASCQ
ncbi:MAG: transcriptional repressor [Planctomycetales bacterium]|nr:transcriptional repressor [Planctomycetales bacterium]